MLTRLYTSTNGGVVLDNGTGAKVEPVDGPIIFNRTKAYDLEFLKQWNEDHLNSQANAFVVGPEVTILDLGDLHSVQFYRIIED